LINSQKGLGGKQIGKNRDVAQKSPRSGPQKKKESILREKLVKKELGKRKKKRMDRGKKRLKGKRKPVASTMGKKNVTFVGSEGEVSAKSNLSISHKKAKGDGKILGKVCEPTQPPPRGPKEKKTFKYSLGGKKLATGVGYEAG